MVKNHTCLAKSKADKDAYGVEGDEGLGIAVKEVDKGYRGASEEENAVVEDEAVADMHELSREKAVISEEAGYFRESCESGIGGEDQDNGGSGLDEEVGRGVFLEDKRAELGEDGF